MPIEIAAIVDRTGRVRTWPATGSHDVIIDALEMRVADGVEKEHFARVYYMADHPKDFFDPEAYVLRMRMARHVRDQGPAAMAAATAAERPAWFDADMWIATTDTMARMLADKLAEDPIVINNYLRLAGSEMTELPRLKVRNGVNIEDSRIAAFADGTVITGSLYAARSPLTPAGLAGVTIGENEGHLWIEGLANMTHLPDSLQILNGMVMAAGSGLTWQGVPPHLRDKVQGIKGPRPG